MLLLAKDAPIDSRNAAETWPPSANRVRMLAEATEVVEEASAAATMRVVEVILASEVAEEVLLIAVAGEAILT